MAFIDSCSRLSFLVICLAICVNANYSFDREFEKIEINRYCDINDNCTHNTLCVDNQCQCRPNHRWNRLNKECESFDCLANETECKTYDQNRECRHALPTLFLGRCECKHGYYEDKRSLKCRSFCFNNRECDPGLSGTGPSNNMVCVDFLCHCRPNYKWNVTANRCEAFNCTIDSECWTGADENRECHQGMTLSRYNYSINVVILFLGFCQCNFQEDMESTKCYLTLYSLFRVRNYKTRKERLLLCTVFIMPSVLLYCLYSQMKKQKMAKKIAQNNESCPTNINYIYMTKTQEMKTSKV